MASPCSSVEAQEPWFEKGDRVISEHHGNKEGVVRELRDDGMVLVHFSGTEKNDVVAVSSGGLQPGASQGLERLPRLPEAELAGTMEMPVPFDESVMTGIFEPSGIRYYVQNSREPPERCELAIVIKTGSVHEAEHERGIAHLLEHLTFRGAKEDVSGGGTNEFSIVHHLERNGIQFGAHQNAYTSLDETCYFLHVPLKQGETDVEDSDGNDGGNTENKAGENDGEEEDQDDDGRQEKNKTGGGVKDNSLLKQCVEALASLVLHARLTDEDVDAERTIVVEEWRSNQGCSQRFGDQYFKEILKGSLYEQRMPIGLLSVIKSVSGETVRDFYRRRYHPRLMAVVAVGDFDKACLKGEVGGERSADRASEGGQKPSLKAVVELLREHFGHAKNVHFVDDGEAPLPPEPKKNVNSVFGKDARCVVLRDPEATYSSVAVTWSQRLWPTRTLADFRRRLVGQVAISCLNNRLRRIGYRPVPPFSTASVEDGAIVPVTLDGVRVAEEKGEAGVRGVSLNVTAAHGELLSGLVSAWTECVRAMLHGFSEKEVEIVRRIYHAQLQTAWLELDQEAAADLSEPLKEHFLKDMPSPGTRWEIAFETSVIGTITVEELREYIVNAFNSSASASLSSPIAGILGKDVLVMVFQPSSKLAALLASFGLPGGSVAGAVADRLSAGLTTVVPWLDLNMEAFEPVTTLTAMRNVVAPASLAALPAAFDEFVRDSDGDDSAAATVLLSTDHPRPQSPGHIVSARHLGHDVHELELSNGLQVVYRVNDYLDDEILMSAFAPGGISEVLPLVRGSRYGHPTDVQKQLPAVFSCSYACSLATEFGKFGLEKEDVADALSGRRVTLSAGLLYYSRYLSCDCSPADLEVQLRLIHVLFTATLKPNAARLATAQRLMRDNLRTRGNDPMVYFDQAVEKLTSAGDSPLLRKATVKDVNTFDADLAMRVYTEGFSDPSEWRFVFSGNLEPAHAKRLFEKYLASIPSIPRSPPPPLFPANNIDASRGTTESEDNKSLGFKFKVEEPSAVTPVHVNFSAKTTTKHVRRRMHDPYGCIEMCWPLIVGGKRANHPNRSSNEMTLRMAHLERLEDNLLLEFLCSILEQRLRDTLRLQMGAIYGVNVSADFDMCPPLNPSDADSALHGHLSVHFSCSPEMLLQLEAVVHSEISSLRSDGPKAGEVLAAVKTTRTHQEESMRTNSHWLSAISSGYNSPRYSGDVAATIMEKERLWEKIASDLEGGSPGGSAGVCRMRDVFNKLLPASAPHVTVTLSPKPPLPWKAMAALLGVAAGAFLVMKKRRGNW